MTETSHRTGVSASGGDVSVYASRVSAMFSALDNRDSDTVIGHLTDDVVVHLGNADPIQGGEAFIALFDQVLSALQGLRHEIHDVWRAAEDPDVVIARMTVHYTRLDGVLISVPCCNVFRLTDGLIGEYRVYVDISPVFAGTDPGH
jgi:limonene-1,2-epoxide hydrolase